MAACASTARVAAGVAIAAAAAAINVLRAIMAYPLGRDFSPTRIAQPACDRLSTSRYGRTRENAHHGSGRFRAALHEGVFDRLGLADRDMQPEQHGGERIGPFVKAQIAQ